MSNPIRETWLPVIRSERDFSPTTRYRDFPSSRTHLHWESQSNTTQDSMAGQASLGWTSAFWGRVLSRDGEVRGGLEEDREWGKGW